MHLEEAFQGIGLRPYSPCHLKTGGNAGSDIDVTWIRRTRIDGDSWESVEVPLGEAGESYMIRVMDGTTVVREVTAGAPNWIYTSADQLLDGISTPFQIAVAQISDRFGAGVFEVIEVSS